MERVVEAGEMARIVDLHILRAGRRCLAAVPVALYEASEIQGCDTLYVGADVIIPSGAGPRDLRKTACLFHEHPRGG